MPNLLLIDSTVGGYQQIVGAINSDTVAVLFNSYEDTYDILKEKVIGSGITNFSTVGIVQHGSDTMLNYRLLIQSTWATVTNVEKEDPSLLTWTEFRGFLEWLKNNFSTQIVDLISCKLYSNNDFVYVMNTLETQTGLNLRASSDDTGNLANGGNWVQESDNVNIEGIYFTSEIQEFIGLLLSYSYKFSNNMVSSTNIVNDMVGNTSTTFASTYWAPKGFVPKSVIGLYGITSSSYVSSFNLVGSSYIIRSWGDTSYGGQTPTPNTGVLSISSTNTAFAAILTGGAVKVWGSSTDGGSDPGIASGATAIIGNGNAFTALLSTGAVKAWGNTFVGGSDPGISSGVIGIAAINSGFAAIKSNGTVQGWGGAGITGTFGSNTIAVMGVKTGGTFAALSSTGAITTLGQYPKTDITSGAIAIASTGGAFAVLRDTGAITCWGDGSSGGGGPSPAITSGAIAIASTDVSFAALMTTGAIRVWGLASQGGTDPGISSGAIAIAAISSAFAVLKADGSIVTWGTGVTNPNITSGAVSIASNSWAFAVLMTNGAIKVWGDAARGGTDPGISSGAVSITSTFTAFAATMSDGSVRVWGEASRGGTNPNITGGVVAIASNSFAFSAIIDGRTEYTYTVISESQKTAIITSFTGSSLSGNIQFNYISGPTTAGVLTNTQTNSTYTIIGFDVSALANKTSVTGISAPFVTSVGASAFSGCTTLQYVYFGVASGVTSFGTSCFDGCSALNYICKNAYNTGSWPASVTTNVRTVLIKNYFPLVVMPSVSLTSATSFTITLNVSGGNVQDNVFTFTNTFTNTKNGTQVYSGNVNTPMTVATTDTYSMTVANTFETNSSNASAGSSVISNYQYGARVKRLLIGN